MLLEGLGSASVANALVRIETFSRNARGEDVRGEDILIPVNRVGAVATGLEELIGKLREQVNAAQEPPQSETE